MSHKQHSHAYYVMTGILFTFSIAIIGFALSFIPGLHKIGQLAISIIIAIIYRQFFHYPEKLRPGIEFSSKRLLRFAIILVGFKLNMSVIFAEGLSLLLRDAIIIIFAIGAAILLAKWFKADRRISLLVGVGTGICGAAAIAAISPIIKSKDEDTAISVGMIALVGTVFSLLFLLVQPILPLTPEQYGIFVGLSLHELAHVALSSAPFGEDVVAIALLAKLGRVFLLIPVAFIFIYIMKRSDSGREDAKQNIHYPYFLIGFIALSIINSYLLIPHVAIPQVVYDIISQVTTWLLTAAMVGLGLNVSLQDLRTKAARPLMVLIVVSIFVIGLGYTMIPA